MTRTKPSTPELAPFIMRDHDATPDASERAMRAGIYAAEKKGDVAEAKRLRRHFDANGNVRSTGPTGLRFAHRERRFDPIDEIITNRRLRHAVDVLRSVAESLATGRHVTVEPYREPADPELTDDERLPPIKNPPNVPDPKNRWTKARRTLDKHGNKVDCPPTWPPKPVKAVRGMPRQFIAEAIYAAIRKKEGDDRRKVLWRVCLDTFETWGMREAIWGIIMERRSLRWACKYTGLLSDGRHVRIIKLNLVSALERVAQYLDESP